MDFYLFLVGPQNSIGFQVNIYVGIYGVMSEIVFGQQWKFHLHGSLLKYFQLVLINFNTDCGDVSSWKKDFELIFGAIFGTVFKEFPTCLDQLQHSLFSHSAYDATSIESNGVKIDGLSYPNCM